VLSHAIESYTAIHYTERPAPHRPILRPAYQGNNPISDVWSLQALRMVGDYIARAVEDTGDDEARSQMILASAYAGVGFGNAGVHLPHGMSYPVSGMVKGRGYRQDGYPNEPEMIPHGFSVILNAPAVFRFTAQVCSRRHLEAAAALGVDISHANEADAGQILADRIIAIMERLKVPSGLKALGYTAADIPALVEGTLPQHRVTKLSPRPATTEDLHRLFEETMQVY
jgi:hydroxyacid-oxoacid transhydrogenase